MSRFLTFGYLLINIAIIAGPLWYTRGESVSYHRKFPALGVSMLVVSGGYIAWDVLVTDWGEWSFNPRYLTGIEVFNLPLEEILFFVTVPYACLFIYEVVLNASKRKTFRLRTGFVIAAIALLAAGSYLFSEQGYTAKALASCALFLGVALLVDRPLLESRQYWLWMAICCIPFLIVNSVLTALPVVQYNPAAIWGPRFVTIPLEDFFYNYSLLSFYLLVYRYAGKAD